MQNGIGRVAKAMGTTLGVFARIRLPRRRASKKGAEKAIRLPTRKKAQSEALQLEIRRIETQLDQVYGRLVEGAGSVGLRGAEGDVPELGALLETARDLKDKLREKRTEASRYQRDAVREKRLKSTVSLEPSPRAEPIRASVPPAAQPPVVQAEAVSPKMRKAIVKAAKDASFGDSSQQVSFEKAVQELLEDDPEIRRMAASRLGELQHPAVLEVLATAAEDPNQAVCTAALNALALMGEPSLERLFIRFAGHPDRHLRLASLRGLATVEGGAAGRVLLSGLEDENAAVRKGAATYLGWRKHKAATRGLMRALRDEDTAVRYAAAESLGAIGDDRAVLPLIRSLSQPSLVVRQAAKKALEALLDKELGIDIANQLDPYDPELEELKDWWNRARIDRQVGAAVELPPWSSPEAGGRARPGAVAALRDRPEPDSAKRMDPVKEALPAARPAEVGTEIPVADSTEEAARVAEPGMPASPGRQRRSGEAVEVAASGLGESGAAGEGEEMETGPLGLDDLDISVSGLDSSLEGLGLGEVKSVSGEPKAEPGQQQEVASPPNGHLPAPDTAEPSEPESGNDEVDAKRKKTTAPE